MMPPPLYLYWGQPTMTFLRWLTIVSASQVHENVVLVRRRAPVAPVVRWLERQEFQKTAVYRERRIPKDVRVVYLEDLAPEIAELAAPDVHTRDLLAFYLLAREGGSFADMDIVFLKPIPEVEENVQVCRFSGPPKKGYAPVTFMQGRPCSIWRNAYSEAKRCFDPDVYESCGAPYIPTNVAPRLPERIVFPWAGLDPEEYERWLFRAKDWPTVPRECVGVHWYAGQNQSWNERIQSLEDFRGGAVEWASRFVVN